ncbi:hypothetical protein E2C01_047441 [Portunus trituberculatus]|uniref:Uncharacterized protein n=1 Tax=Portunus trituberculatus TaxID=210409 RepID=A0A5B7G7W9_PORTR|nr:hypothetical protein [Portunus trituberculatus]
MSQSSWPRTVQSQRGRVPSHEWVSAEFAAPRWAGQGQPRAAAHLHSQSKATVEAKLECGGAILAHERADGPLRYVWRASGKAFDPPQVGTAAAQPTAGGW